MSHLDERLERFDLRDARGRDEAMTWVREQLKACQQALADALARAEAAEAALEAAAEDAARLDWLEAARVDVSPPPVAPAGKGWAILRSEDAPIRDWVVAEAPTLREAVDRARGR